jgi:hypothetical protein
VTGEFAECIDSSGRNVARVSAGFNSRDADLGVAPAGATGPRRQRHLLAIDSGRTPTEVLTVETNAEVSAWLLGENGKDG